MFTGCPGSSGVKGTPTLDVKTCPKCGGEIEIFSSEKTALCSCGFEAYNDTQTCIAWCRFARACVGEELYDRFMGDRAQGTDTQ